MMIKVPFPTPVNYSIEELKRRLLTLKQQEKLSIFGKKRNSAIGESLEKYLGLSKNSSKKADWGDYELKTISQTSGKLRLMSLNWDYLKKYSAKQLVLDYGKNHFSKHLEKPVIRLDWKIPYSAKHIDKLHYRINDKNKLELLFNKEVLASNNLDKFENHYMQKMRNLVLVEVEINNDQTFKIERVKLLEYTSFRHLLTAIKKNIVELSFALMLIEPNSTKEKFNNRGSSLRIPLKKISNLYEDESIIC